MILPIPADELWQWQTMAMPKGSLSHKAPCIACKATITEEGYPAVGYKALLNITIAEDSGGGWPELFPRAGIAKLERAGFCEIRASSCFDAVKCRVCKEWLALLYMKADTSGIFNQCPGKIRVLLDRFRIIQILHDEAPLVYLPKEQRCLVQKLQDRQTDLPAH